METETKKTKQNNNKFLFEQNNNKKKLCVTWDTVNARCRPESYKLVLYLFEVPAYIFTNKNQNGCRKNKKTENETKKQ